MKTIKFTLLISSCMLWMNQAESKEIKVPGVLLRSSTTKSGSSNTRTDSYTCTVGSNVCFVIQTNSADSTRVSLPYLADDTIKPGDVITIIAEGQPDVQGVFVEYKNSPVLDGDISTRTHRFTTTIAE